jgi:hypothetical protein
MPWWLRVRHLDAQDGTGGGGDDTNNNDTKPPVDAQKLYNDIKTDLQSKFEKEYEAKLQKSVAEALEKYKQEAVKTKPKDGKTDPEAEKIAEELKASLKEKEIAAEENAKLRAELDNHIIKGAFMPLLKNKCVVGEEDTFAKLAKEFTIERSDDGIKIKDLRGEPLFNKNKRITEPEDLVSLFFEKHPEYQKANIPASRTVNNISGITGGNNIDAWAMSPSDMLQENLKKEK